MRKAVNFQIALLILALSGCHSRPTVERRTDRALLHQPVAPNRVVAPGVVEAWDGETRLAPNEQGQIVELLVREGDRVTAGQLLARLDDSAQARAVALAEAELGEARAALRRTLRGSTSGELALARAERAAAETRAAQAARDAARARSLRDAGGVPLAEAERAESEESGMRSSLSAADARLDIVVRGARSEDRDAAAARFAAAEVRLTAARDALTRRRISAPLAATVLWSRRHVGELFLPSATPLMVLGDVNRLQIRAEVDELDSTLVRVGLRCEAFDDSGARVTGCTVARLSPEFGRRALGFEAPTARADVRVREVVVEVDPGTSLAPGQRFWVHITSGSTG
jgi:multidrug efflux pump subunit AcrA (membrane-fusion protein)